MGSCERRVPILADWGGAVRLNFTNKVGHLLLFRMANAKVDIPADPFLIKIEDVGFKFLAATQEVFVEGCLRGLHMYLPRLRGNEQLAQEGLLEVLQGWGACLTNGTNPMVMPAESASPRGGG